MVSVYKESEPLDGVFLNWSQGMTQIYCWGQGCSHPTPCPQFGWKQQLWKWPWHSLIFYPRIAWLTQLVIIAAHPKPFILFSFPSIPVFLLFLLLPIFFLFFNFVFIYQSMHNLTFYTTSFFVPCSSPSFSVSFPLPSICPSLHLHHFFLPTIFSSLLPSCRLPISPSFSPLSLHFSIPPSFYNPFLLPSLYLTVLPTISLSPILSFHPFLFLLFP